MIEAMELLIGSDVERLVRELSSQDIHSLLFILAVNRAHAVFIQGKYVEAASLYQEIAETTTCMLDCDPIIIANLCVSLIRQKRTDEAEKIIQRVETEQ